MMTSQYPREFNNSPEVLLPNFSRCVRRPFWNLYPITNHILWCRYIAYKEVPPIQKVTTEGHRVLIYTCILYLVHACAMNEIKIETVTTLACKSKTGPKRQHTLFLYGGVLLPYGVQAPSSSSFLKLCGHTSPSPATRQAAHGVSPTPLSLHLPDTWRSWKWIKETNCNCNLSGQIEYWVMHVVTH